MLSNVVNIVLYLLLASLRFICLRVRLDGSSALLRAAFSRQVVHTVAPFADRRTRERVLSLCSFKAVALSPLGCTGEPNKNPPYTPFLQEFFHNGKGFAGMCIKKHNYLIKNNNYLIKKKQILLVPWSCWSSGPLVRWSSGPPSPWSAGPLVPRSSWSPGPLLVLCSPSSPPLVLFWSSLLPLGCPGQPVVSFPTQAILVLYPKCCIQQSFPQPPSSFLSTYPFIQSLYLRMSTFESFGLPLLYKQF